MKLSKKCQYALKAVFELAWRNHNEPISTQEIAKSQCVSPRFMEIILNELKHGGFVESKRGNEGGYRLARDIKKLTVREIIEYIEGPISIADNNNDRANIGNNIFNKMWIEVNNAICEVCDKKNFADLVKLEKIEKEKCVINYSI